MRYDHYYFKILNFECIKNEFRKKIVAPVLPEYMVPDYLLPLSFPLRGTLLIYVFIYSLFSFYLLVYLFNLGPHR